jgi:HEPN domain-containing protein
MGCEQSLHPIFSAHFRELRKSCIILKMKDWKAQLQTEFERAEDARARGNEGQARVCARRAAGIAIREYYTRRGQAVRTPSAYDLLQLLAGEPHLSPDLKQAAAYLTLRVTEEFKLPIDVDLLAEARKLCNGLLSEIK